MGPKERWDMLKKGIDPDARPDLKQKSVPHKITEADYRKPGEPCDHPAYMVTTDESPGLGSFKFCKACGRIITPNV